MKEQAIAFVKTTLVSLFAFLTPIHPLMGAICGLIFIDFVLGNWSAHKNDIPIQSKEWKRTLIKFFLYELTVLVAFLLDSFFIPGDIVVRIAAMAIGLVEAKSIFEHIYTLTGLNVWSLLKDKLKNSVSASTKDIIKNQADAEVPGSKDNLAP